MREVAGESIVLLRTKEANDVTKVVSLNESSKLIWETLHDREFDVEDVVKTLLDNYEVEEAVAREDAGKFVDKMIELGIVLQ